jgi:hypothetical protein
LVVAPAPGGGGEERAGPHAAGAVRAGELRAGRHGSLPARRQVPCLFQT